MQKAPGAVVQLEFNVIWFLSHPLEFARHQICWQVYTVALDSGQLGEKLRLGRAVGWRFYLYGFCIPPLCAQATISRCLALVASTKPIAEKLIFVIAQRHGIKASTSGGKGAGEVNVATVVNS